MRICGLTGHMKPESMCRASASSRTLEMQRHISRLLQTARHLGSSLGAQLLCFRRAPEIYLARAVHEGLRLSLLV